MTRRRLGPAGGVPLGYGLVALGAMVRTGTMLPPVPASWTGVQEALLPWLGRGGLLAGLALVVWSAAPVSPFRDPVRALPAPLSSLPHGWRRVVPFVLRQVGVAFLLRWAFGGLLFWAALPVLALADCRRRGVEGRHETASSVVLYLLFYGYGAGGLWNFVGHFFMSDAVAASVGWAAGSPFQQELAFYALGTGVVALMTPWWRDRFWVAAALAPSLFVYGAAYTHVEDFLVNGNTAPANWSIAAVGANVVIPTVVLLSTWWHRHTAPRAPR